MPGAGCGRGGLLAVAPPFGAVLVETTNGFVLDTVAAGAFALHAVFLSLLVALSFIDFDTQLLPDVLTKPGIVLGIAAGLWPGLAGVVSDDPTTARAMRQVLASLAGMLVGGGSTWAIRAVGSALFRREAMGFGDVKLMAMIGAFLGWQAALLSMFLGCVLGAAVGGLGAAFGRGTVIPFGPYLAAGALVAMFWRAVIVTALFTTWPDWASRNPGAQWLVVGVSLVLMLALLVLVRRARRSS